MSYFTGVPNISIPIHTVSSGGLNVPISLSYHASGIKLAEPASWVGQGWSLQAGGMITRSTMGLPDELSGGSGYFDNGSSLLIPMLPGSDPSAQQVRESANGIRDTEPDLFNFSIPGYNGKFLFDKDKKAHFIPKADFKISYVRYNNNEKFIRFVITGPDGTRYIFGTLDSEAQTSNSGIEYTYYDGQSNASVDAPSSWYLRRMETGNKLFSIDFEYEEERYAYKSLATCRFEWNSSSSSISCGGTPYGSGSYKNVIIHRNKGKRLKTILSGTNKVVFVATTDRQDLDTYSTTSKKALDKIEIYDASGTTCYKAFNMSYTYFTDPAGSASEYKRLKLNNVTEAYCDGTVSNPSYVFTYDAGLVPNRLSKAIDHWGFSNGQTTNETKFNIPALSVAWQGQTTSPPFAGANRESSESHMKNGSLTSIQYPTGGRTVFTYEANEISTTETINTISYLTSNLSNCSNPSGTCCTTLNNTTTKTFTSADLSGARFYLGLTNLNTSTQNPNGLHFCNSGQNPGPMPTVKITVRQTGSSTILGSKNFNISPTTGYGSMDTTLTYLATLSPSINYTFTIDVSNGKGEFYVYKKTTITQTVPKAIGGLRLAQIKSHDRISTNQDIIKTYTYINPSTTKSSGIQYFKPEYYGYAYNYNGTAHGVVFHDYSIAPLNTVNGYHVGYQYVQEDLGSIGSNKYIYHTEQDFTTPTAHPYAPDPSRVFDGKILIASAYDASNSLVSMTNNTFNNDTYDNIPGIIYKAYVFINFAGSTVLSAKSYVPRTSVFRLANVETTIDGISTNHSHEYNPNNLYLAANKDSTTNSDGKKHVTQYTFPHELSGSVYANMVAKNIVTPVITTKKVDNVIVDRQTTEYQNQTLGTVSYPYPHIFKRDEVTWTGATATYSRDTNVVQSTITQRSTITGFPTKITIDGWSDPIELTWNANGTRSQWKFKDFIKNYQYYPGTSLLKKFTDIDKTSSQFTYDDLMRLKTAKDSCRNVTTTLNYNYGTPSSGGNNISTTTDYTASPTSANSALTTITNKQFFDGLGRPFQTIKVKQGTASANDVVIRTTYDNQGKVKYQYEPVQSAANNNGAFYTASTGHYSTIAYEPNPLNRPTSQTHTAWIHPTSTTYGSNTSMINGIMSGKLFKQTIIDGDGKESITYTDTRGRTIATAMAESGGSNALTTLYEYDDKDRPTKVIPPASSSGTTGLNFTYQYYGNDLVKKKKVPDQSEIEYRYNNRDLMIHYQDGYLQSQGKWMAYNYDTEGREIKSGFTTSVLLNNSITDPTIAELLTELVYNTSGNHIDKIEKSFTHELKPNGTLGMKLESNYTYDDCGRVETEKAQTLLSATNVNNNTHSYTYDRADNLLFDDQQQIIYGTHNIDATRTIDFAGRPEEVIFAFAGLSKSISKTTYTEKGQIAQMKLGNASSLTPLQLVDYTYKENGWLERINNSALSNGDLFYQELRYDDPLTGSGGAPSFNGNIAEAYHKVRGQDFFKYSFSYDDYNRLDTASSHTLAGGNFIDADKLSTTYSYDDRGNMMTLTRKGQYQSGASFLSGQIDNLDYDYLTGTNKLDKITDLVSGTLKNRGVKGSNGQSYGYDANGNVTTDPSKGTTIHYNHLNLPRLVDFGGGRQIRFTYDASGNQLRKEVKQGTEVLEDRYYIGSAEYKDGALVQVMHDHGRIARKVPCDQNQHIGGILDDGTTYHGDHIISNSSIVPTGTTIFKADESITMNEEFTVQNNKLYEAYIAPCVPGAWQYEYIIKDHLGNARVVFADVDNKGTVTEDKILQASAYYPFGMEQEGEWEKTSKHDYNYQYNGKELHKDFDLDWSNYGARFYDPSIGRFTSVDPLASKMPSWSPYSYAFNNPISNIDVGGLYPASVTGDPPNNGLFRGLKQRWNEFKNDVFGSYSGPSFGEFVNTTVGAIEKWSGAYTEIGRNIVDEVPVAGELVSAYEGDYAGIIVGIVPGGKKVKKALDGKFDKVIEGIDDLIDAAGSFSGRKTKIGENTIQGNVDDVFKTVTEGGEALESGAVRMGDGRIISQHVSTSTGERTISINQEGQKLKKVRFENQ